MSLLTAWKGLVKIKTIPGEMYVLPALPPHLAFTQGRHFFLKPYTGNDSADGTTPARAFKTFSRALAAMTANQNDILYVLSESNTTAQTSSYLTTTLTWNKDLCHIIGVGSGNPYNQRTRIAWSSGAASASDIPLMTVSANGCYFSNLCLAVGSSDANLSFGLNVTGDRNTFENISVAFPQNATNDCAGAYALKIDGADECLFKNCAFGSFTIDLGTAANQVLLIDSGVSFTVFENCKFIARIESSTNSPIVRTADAASIGFGCVWFDRCKFISTSVNGATAQNGTMKIATQTDGRIVATDCWHNGGKFDVDDHNMILNGCTGVPIDDNAGEVLAV